jgi:hypothetical protein
MRWKLNRYLLSIHSIHLSKSLFVLDWKIKERELSPWCY